MEIANQNYFCASCDGIGMVKTGIKCGACNGTGKQIHGTKKDKLPLIDQFRLIHVYRRLDLEQVKAALIASGIPIHNRTDEEILGVAHTVRLQLIDATQAEKSESETYLRQRGYQVPKAA